MHLIMVIDKLVLIFKITVLVAQMTLHSSHPGLYTIGLPEAQRQLQKFLALHCKEEWHADSTLFTYKFAYT